MKKITKHIMLGFALLTFGLSTQAQVTISQANFNRPIGFIDSVWVQDQPIGSLPSEGAAQVWDYSSLVKNREVIDDYQDATQDPNFVGATNKIREMLPFFDYDFYTQRYEAFDNTGWYDMGIMVEDTTVSLLAVTGAATDSLRFVGGVFPYQGRLDFVKFPTNYQDSWTGSYVRTVAYELSVGAFGLNKVPGAFERTFTRKREVVGYGTITVPTPNGPSKPIEVLQTKWVQTYVDTFYLGGHLAPPALTAAFNVTQGQTGNDSSYVFYTPGFGGPVMAFYIVGDSTGALAWRPKANTASVASVNEYQLVASNVFPNPVAKNGQLKIVAEGFEGDAQFRLTDVMGRVVFETTTQNQGDGNYRLQLPAYLPAGNYFYQHTDVKAKNSAQGKLIVE